MSKNKHALWNWLDDWHKGEKYGCYFRHPHAFEKKDIPYEPCFYPKNSFEKSKTRDKELYNKDHLTRAKDLGYLDPSKISKMVAGRAAEMNAKNKLKGPARDGTNRKYRKGYKKKNKKWKNNMTNMLQSSVDLLLIDEKAWHINYQILKPVTPWWTRKEKMRVPSAENFLPATLGGWNYHFPYKHNHHHLIPIGAFKKCVIRAGSNKISRQRKRKIVLAAKWNINAEENMIMLPNEVPAAEIVGLPAHCPWNTRSHTKYSNFVEKELKKISDQINKAAQKSECEKVDKLDVKLENISEKLYDKIKDLKTDPVLK